MGTCDRPVSEPTQGATSGRALLLATCTAAILSAALLFMVQPMFTKLVLPRFAGARAVWSVAIVFFQAALLAGYAYAHWLTRYASGRLSVALHLVAMLAAVFALPPAIASGWERPPAGTEPLWLIALFAISIGLPFFSLPPNSPFFHPCFPPPNHPPPRAPYFLYAASNIGSFLALVSYPTLVEPFVRLGDQAWFWSAGFCLLLVLLIACGVLLWRSPDTASVADDVTSAPPTSKDLAFWVALAAVPAGLLVAVTAHISTDVAAVPMLWVLPLALYLLTYVIAFARRPVIPHWLVVALQPPSVVALVAVIIFDPLKTIISILAVHLAVFFVNALMCHGELARRRPPARYLTVFYVCISAAVLIARLPPGFIAPHVFHLVAEYPLLIALSLLCRPGLVLPVDRSPRHLLLGGIAAGGGVLLLFWVFPVA